MIQKNQQGPLDHNNNNNRITFNFHEYEEKEKREMEWLVETTSKVLGLDILGENDEVIHDLSNITCTSTITSQQHNDHQQPTMSKDLTRRACKLMRAWAKRKTEQAPHVAELIMRRLIAEYAMGNENVYITTKTYNLLLGAWSKSRDIGAPNRSEAILREMENQHANGNLRVRPNVKSYNLVMACYANRWKGHCYDKVKEVFERLVEAAEKVSLDGITASNDNDSNQQRRRRSEDTQPNRRSYNLLLGSIAASVSLDDQGEKAEAVLRRMQQQCSSEQQHEDSASMPDINSYNMVLWAWSRTRVDKVGNLRRGYREQRMQQILDEVLDDSNDVLPNADTFNHMLSAYFKSKTPNNMQMFDATLKQMEESYAAGNELAKPNRVTVNTVLVAYAQSGLKEGLATGLCMADRMEQQYDVQPDTYRHNVLIDSCSKHGHADAAGLALNTLDKMEHNYRSGMMEQRPDVITFCSVIDCIAKSGAEDTGDKADMVLERMRDLHQTCGGDPANGSVYNALINSWASSKSKKAMHRALAILEEMETMHAIDDFVPAPTTISYSSVMKVLGQGSNKGARRCVEMLEKLERNAVDATPSDVVPDSFTYVACITAIARSRLQDKAEKAYEVLQRMLAAYETGNAKARPNILAVNSALNACAHVDPDSNVKVEAFVIMVAILNLFNSKKFKGLEPNHTSYGLVLRAVSILLPPEDDRRQEMVERVFRKACREGQVGKLVLKQMKFAASAEAYQSLLGRNLESKVSVQDLPISWTANVHEDKHPMTGQIGKHTKRRY